MKEKIKRRRREIEMKEKMNFPKNVTNQKNPPDESVQNVSK